MIVRQGLTSVSGGTVTPKAGVRIERADPLLKDVRKASDALQAALHRLRQFLVRKLRRSNSLKVKLIVPYVVLTLFTALIGTYIVTRLVSSSTRERFMNQLYESSRVSADGLLRTERKHLSDLRLMSYTRGVSDAIAAGDQDILQSLLWPLVMNNNTEAVAVIDLQGKSLLTLVLDPVSGRTIRYEGEDFSGVNQVQSVLQGEQDDLGDKFSGFIDTQSGTYLFSSAPVMHEEGGLAGVILVGTRVNSLLFDLKQQIMADLIFLDMQGKPLGSTFPGIEEGAESLGLSSAQIEALAVDQIMELEINHRRYVAAYTPLMIRERIVGYKAVALCSDYLVNTEVSSRNVFTIVFTAATMGVILIGYFLSRSIADPVIQLQLAALSVAEGDLDKRSGLQRKDEVGQLAAVFDLMVFRLRKRTAQAARLYAEAVERNDELNRINARLQSTQQQLIQSEKLAAVGQLTAGIVHDVRNPLAVIKGMAEEIEEDPLLADDMRKTMKTIRDSASRAASIVSDLLTFARQSTPSRRTQNLVETVHSAVRLTDYLARKGRVQVRTDVPEQPVGLEYDAQQIEQVLVNLIQNAIQAMPDGGELVIAVQPSALQTQILVRDTGTGIPASHLRRIFDPFFTTKKEGEGTGLGLSVSYGIITRHGGNIEVMSELGTGTVFTITLPNRAEVGDEYTGQNSGCG